MAGVVGSCPKDPVDVDGVEDVTPEAVQWSIWWKNVHFLYDLVYDNKNQQSCKPIFKIKTLKPNGMKLQHKKMCCNLNL